MTRTITTFILFLVIQHAYAAEAPDGAKIFRIEDDSSSTCIDLTNHKISLHLRKAMVEKDIGWFSQDKEVGLIINTTVEGETENGTRKVKFPRMFKATVEEYNKGVVSIPIEIKLFHRFLLTNEDSIFDSMQIDFVTLKKHEKTKFGAGLAALAKLTESLPTPPNPFSDGFKYFVEFSNDVLENSLNEKNNVDETVKEGGISLAFSETNICGGDFEKTGTIAVVKGFRGKEKDGVADINKEYCWKAKGRPSFELKFAPLSVAGSCKNIQEGSYNILRNPYYAFVLNAYPNKLPKRAQVRTQRVDIIASLNRKVLSVDRNALNVAVGSVFIGDYESKDTALFTEKVSGQLRMASYSKYDEISNVGSSEQTILWDTTREDSVAFEIAESIRRCDFHGIPLEDCL
ncbi:hypothetical protein Ssed_3747 [Shewanella sediminis HAW-EB3]|uniref:Uncharacterized protein n=1 Tax=Shewanella sediminis (strain HAW-EB3) TaxID=425104 RepID=A8FZS8_SHESH|nr:hypothetical protein [Shewanella sediminis]ABV38351.1 hypothetical protein Ssed_3747 [Shewanella sediminis HAW-EB3]